MGLNLLGPAGESPIQAMQRLTALKLSFDYAGGGYYSGGPNGEGCDAEDMNDLNNDLACSAMEAVPVIDRLVAVLKEAREDMASFVRDEHSYDSVQSGHGLRNLNELYDKMDAAIAEASPR